jgi:hypothetical protein
LDRKPKETTRDLSELKTRLGLADLAPPPAPVQAQAPAQAGPVPGPTPLPGDVAAAAVDPFASAVSPRPPPRSEQVITDAGPPLELPAQKPSRLRLVITIALLALIPMSACWACGRIYGARVLFNKTIDDAQQIRAEVDRISRVNAQVAERMARARARARARAAGGRAYDEQLLEDLKAILRASPDRTAERQKKLFRTNYALMEGIVIDRLFKYYNNTLRLMDELQRFIRRAEASKELIEGYGSAADRRRKYGIVFAEDAGSYYLGQLVEMGDLICAGEQTGGGCRRRDVRGFYVRSTAGGAWSPRPGKPGSGGRLTEVVVPIIPDESWRQVASARRGYLAYADYTQRLGRVAAIAALLARDVKQLQQDLGQAAGREKLFVPFG